MKYCKKCGVYVRGSRSCPLCSSVLGKNAESEDPSDYPYTKERPKESRILLRILLLLSAAGISICIFLNLLFWDGVLWSFIVAAATLLLWETCGLLIRGKKNIGLRIIGQMFTVLILLITTDAVTGWNRWSVEIAVPFVIILSTLVMTVILYVNRRKWREYMIYQFLITLNGFFPVLLYWFHLAEILWPAVVGASYSILTLAGMLLFANRQFKSELKKRFHI
jgi:hypothetical protein